ncbi:MAG: AprI/Inh family metalloprotease inhibitor [Pseudolabrys sp.]|nr:AprI/Inh family metalloprotease inhibitor [Pseudolabrys sp.]MBV9955689.1 AprI/Inh family metalloprotease inhibitor [Pseudolabrys sp.]
MTLPRRAACIAALLLWPALGFAQQQPAPALNESARGMVGNWEFSNADRDRTCTVTFKAERAAPGLKVEFDAKCAELFPVVRDVVAWRFQDNDNLFLLDRAGKPLVEFSEVESGIFEAPTPGLGVLFLQNAADAGPAPRQPDEVAGDYAVMRGGKILCSLALSADSAADGFAVTVRTPCDASVARQNFNQWRMDRAEILLVPARGNPWRFEAVDEKTWRRVPEGANPFTLVRQ